MVTLTGQGAKGTTLTDMSEVARTVMSHSNEVTRIEVLLLNEVIKIGMLVLTEASRSTSLTDLTGATEIIGLIMIGWRARLIIPSWRLRLAGGISLSEVISLTEVTS